jgi:hypothetical protein
MNLLERYRAGECEAVWLEIGAWQESDLNETTLQDVRVVALETMRRVKVNLELIVQRLRGMGFEFGAENSIEEDALQDGAFTVHAQPIKPLQHPEDTLHRISSAVGGAVPLAFRVFALEIGEVDLRGRHPRFQSDFLLDAFMLWVYVPDSEEVQDLLESKAEDAPDVVPVYEHAFAPDEFHKENVSGGAAYSMGLPDDRIDPPVLFTPFDGSFTAYLRDSILRHGGFPGFADIPAELLEELTTGLTPF